MIDLVVPYVNGEDPIWKKLYKQYATKDRVRRYRDYDTIRYLFRSIDTFCPWIDRVILVLQQESQIPKWLNVNSPKLKIIYHKDFIPKQFLPTFNSNVIEMFFNRIPNLSEQFIVANDDMVFLKPNDMSDWFSTKGEPQHFIKVLREDKGKPKKGKIFHNIVYNNVKLANKLANTGKMIDFKNWHIPIAYSKSTWDFVWDKCKTEILNSLANSKFRTTKNLSHWVFHYYEMIVGITKHNPNFEQHGYFCIEDEVTKEQIEQKIDTAKVACFNDGVEENEELFDVLKNKLESIMPNKSCFEV